MEKEEIVISKKHIPLRIILLVIAIIIAITSFTFFVTSLTKKNPGFYEISVNSSQIAPTYDNDVTLMYYASGKSKDIKRLLNNLKEDYSKILLDSYVLLDNKNTYDGYINIAMINKHLNENVRVNQELFDILKDAYNKTIDRKNYNIFATLLHDKWDNLFYYPSYNIDSFDPLYNDNYQKELVSIKEQVINLDNFSIEFDESNLNIKLNVAESYLSFLDENDYSDYSNNIVSLNNLFEAYRLEYITKKLLEKGYNNGYLYTTSGVMVSLQDNTDKEYFLYDKDYSIDKIYQLGYVKVSGKSSCNQFKVFSFSDDTYDNYQIIKDEKVYYRHKLIDIENAKCQNVLKTLNVSSTNLDIVNNAYITLNILRYDNLNEINAYIKSLSDINIAYTCIDDSTIVYTNSDKTFLYENEIYKLHNIID